MILAERVVGIQANGVNRQASPEIGFFNEKNNTLGRLDDTLATGAAWRGGGVARRGAARRGVARRGVVPPACLGHVVTIHYQRHHYRGPSTNRATRA